MIIMIQLSRVSQHCIYLLNNKFHREKSNNNKAITKPPHLLQTNAHYKKTVISIKRSQHQ